MEEGMLKMERAGIKMAVLSKEKTACRSPVWD